MRRRAFTLIELLVVVAIIAVLMAVLLPSLQRAKRRSELTVCAANQRQLMIAMRFYAADFSDAIPMRTVGSTLGFNSWVYFLGGRWYQDATGGRIGSGTEYAQFYGTIGPNLYSKVWICPLITADTPLAEDNLLKQWNQQYAMNVSLLLNTNFDVGPSYSNPVANRLNNIPQAQVVLADAPVYMAGYWQSDVVLDYFSQFDNGEAYQPSTLYNDGWGRNSGPWPLGNKGINSNVSSSAVVGNTHSGFLNVSFPDAHVEQTKILTGNMFTGN